MGRALLYGFLLLMAGFFLLPVYLVVLTALKEPARITLETVWQWPHPPYWESFRTAWEAFRPKFQNSVVLAVSATLLSALVGSLNGYVLAKWPFRGSGLLFALILFGLVLVHVIYGIPIVTLIFRNYYSEIPDELVEAARIDGAGFFGIFRHVILPLSVPAFVVVAIWQFTQIWNEFLFAVTLTRPESQPITVALAQLAGGEAVKWNLPMAGAILAALPTLLVYILLGRYFLRGLLAGSVKG